MSDDLRPNLLLDELWEAAGKSVEKFAERTNKAAADLRVNTWLDQAFGGYKDLAAKARLSIANLVLSVKVTIARFAQLNEEVAASAAESRKAGSRTANRQSNDPGQVASSDVQTPHGPKPENAGALQKMAAGVIDRLKNVMQAFRHRGASFQLNLQRPRPAPSQAKPSSSIGSWSAAIQGIAERLRTFRQRLATAVEQIIAEFKNTVGQLRDFGGDVVAAARMLMGALIGVGAQIWSRVLPAIVQPIAALGSALRSLRSIVMRPIFDLAVAIRKGIAGLSGAVANSSFGKTMRDVGQAIYQPLAAVGEIVLSGAGMLAKAFGATVAWITTDLQSMFTGKKKTNPQTGEETGSAIGGVISIASKVVGSVTSAINGMMAGLSYIGDFVKIINPGLMIQFQMVMSDLSAVIGTALTPIMEAVVPLFRSLADTLYPLAKQFAEILKPLLEVVSQLAESIIKLVGTILTALVPIVVWLSDGLAVMAGALSVFVSTAKALFDGLAGFFASFISGSKPGEFKETIDFIIGLFRKLSNNLLLAAASVAKFFGVTSFITGMIEGAKNKKEDTTGLAAAQNPAYKSIEELGRSTALQAAIATSGVTGKKSQDELALDMVDQLTQIRENGTNLVDLLERLPISIAKAIKDGATTIFEDAATNTVNYLADAGDAIITLPQNLVTIAANYFNQ